MSHSFPRTVSTYSKSPSRSFLSSGPSVSILAEPGVARRLREAVSEVFFLVLISLLPPLAVFCDLAHLSHGLPENSVTETFQELFLLYSMLTLWVSSRKHPRARGCFRLMSGLFACMLIRENDSLLDHVWHGFWFWPALLVALYTVATVAWSDRNTVLLPALGIVSGKIFVYLALGLVVILVLSRLFGSGRMVWNTFLTGYYSQGAKDAIQEGLELFGYTLVAYGSGMWAHRLNRRAKSGGPVRSDTDAGPAPDATGGV